MRDKFQERNEPSKARGRAIRQSRSTNVVDRFKDYKKDTCWQYSIRVENLAEDLKEANLATAEVEALSVSDFKFEYIDKTDKATCQRISQFIERHEWLGKMPNRPTHRFMATYKGIIAGVVIMATPNAFSNIIGKENKNKEKLISRGACISWSPKNLGSSLIMFSIKWMALNTDFRVFTAYSDPEAKELGTIYQACNFIYLGKESGSTEMFMNPERPDLGWFSSREFRKISKYRLYAKELKVEWNADWNTDWTIHWDKMPSGLKEKLVAKAKEFQAKCVRRAVPKKHKYCYILGRNRKETKELVELFKKENPDKIGLAYPKERGN